MSDTITLVLYSISISLKAISSYFVSSSEFSPNTGKTGKDTVLKIAFPFYQFMFAMCGFSQTNYRGLQIVICYTEKRFNASCICLSARHGKVKITPKSWCSIKIS